MTSILYPVWGFGAKSIDFQAAALVAPPFPVPVRMARVLQFCSGYWRQKIESAAQAQSRDRIAYRQT